MRKVCKESPGYTNVRLFIIQSGNVVVKERYRSVQAIKKQESKYILFTTSKTETTKSLICRC